ncbi:MAG TPA: alpha-hydroxy-acid oxidizing protein [Candidatus Avidesulfovibrio excrementigallinarum]|nr:alpha-hydroxy-acid oxidizing protein [Candidatus Avidesulfovibrio excrementigallinarum]
MNDVRELARERMKGFCRVCPVCDGRACAGEVPGMGGLVTGASFRNNVTALAAVRLNMTALHDVREPKTRLSLLGFDMELPVLAAPIGGVSLNMGESMSEADYIHAVISGSRAAGAVGCTGDGVPPFIVDSAEAALRAENGQGIPFVKPWEGKELYEKAERLLAPGCPVLGVDVDAAGLITLRKMGRPVAPMSQKELEELARFVHAAGRKLLIKGIMTSEAARRAVDAGVDAIVVSNHGGRVLDHCPGTAEVLPAIAQSVRGQIHILVDGGIRTGVDVLKMLALGAEAVLIGRPVSVAAIGGGLEGVKTYFETIKAQLTQAMLLTGCASLAGIDERIIYRG